MAAVAVTGCAAGSPHPSQSQRLSPGAAGSQSTDSSTTVQCPVTTPPVKARAGDRNASLGTDPTGVLMCVTNEPASKQAATGAGTPLPASVAVVLARLIDQAAPADKATATRCAPTAPLSVARFAYPSGPTDVVLSTGCSSGAVAYLRDRGYLLPSLLASYLQGATDPASEGLTPNVMGRPLSRAVAAAQQAGATMLLEGELVDQAEAGTVLLQSPTLGDQVGVIAAVHRSPPCHARQLAVQYLTGGAGAGNDFGTIMIRNTSDSWCELRGPASVTGISAGHPVTNTRTVTVDADLELSPHAHAAVPGKASPTDQLAASLRLSAGYRDDAGGSPCTPHWVVPTSWQVAVGSATLTVANSRASASVSLPGAAGLITCRGRFGAGPLRTATSLIGSEPNQRRRPLTSQVARGGGAASRA